MRTFAISLLVLASLLSVGAAQASDPRDLAPGTPPLPTDCVTPAITYTCTVDAGVCYFRQTNYFDGRQVNELRCLGLVDCTWSSDGSAARAETEPFCPLPF